MSSLIAAGNLIRDIAAWLQWIATYTANIALAVVLFLLLVRFLLDRFHSNPFSRFAFYARRPTDKWFYEIKSSQFYYPIKRALGFEPIWVLMLLAFVLLFFLLRALVSDVVLVLQCTGITLSYFGSGETLSAGKALIGTLLLCLIYFLMGLMTILVIHSWFGLFDRAAYWAGQRIYPLMRSLDSSGRLGPFLFLILFFVLNLLASAVLSAFF